MAASEREARSLVQHLSDQAGLCVADVAALARVTCNDTRVEVLAQLPRALEARQARVASTAELLRLMPPVLSELEQSLDSALQSVTLLPAIYAGVCTARTQHAASTPLPSGRAPPAG